MMRNRLWLEPVGEALAAMEAYRREWAEARRAYAQYARSRGAETYTSFRDSRPMALVFDRHPDDLPPHFRHVFRGHHLGVLRSPRARATREAVLAEQRVIDALPEIPNLPELLKGFGIPLSFGYVGEGRQGYALIGHWSPCWTSMTGRIFLAGDDFRGIGKEYPDCAITFDAGDGTVPERHFRTRHAHEVAYVQGEENLAAEAA